MKDTLGARDYDWWLLAIAAAICTLGVIEIYSATHGSALAGMHTRQIRWIVIGAVFALYLNFVVLIVQSFQKVPVLHALAPKQTEPPFLVVQLVSLVAFFVLGTLAVKRFRTMPITLA